MRNFLLTIFVVYFLSSLTLVASAHCVRCSNFNCDLHNRSHGEECGYTQKQGGGQRIILHGFSGGALSQGGNSSPITCLSLRCTRGDNQGGQGVGGNVGGGGDHQRIVPLGGGGVNSFLDLIVPSWLRGHGGPSTLPLYPRIQPLRPQPFQHERLEGAGFRASLWNSFSTR